MGTVKYSVVGGSTVQPTWVVELTPRGRAAVAVVLVDGPDAVHLVDECFHPADGRRLADVPQNRIRLGRWGDASGEELIACRRSAESVELHCHGGVAAVAAVIERLCECGCRSMSWQDWVRDHEADPIRAAARVALADAPTARTAAVLLDQYNGALTTTVLRVLTAAAAGDWPTVAEALDCVLAQRGVGTHLTVPWRVVLAGRPNVGKSSLLNALVGFQRAIVCDVPGTTRDVVTMSTGIDGWPIQLADTAGLRETCDELESAGVARAAAALADADLIIWVADATESGAKIAPPLPPATPWLDVLNKIDLLPTAKRPVGRPWDALTSAVTGEGIGDLMASIGRALVPTPPASGTAVPFTAEQVRRFGDARAAADRHDAAAVIDSLQPLLGG